MYKQFNVKHSVAFHLPIYFKCKGSIVSHIFKNDIWLSYKLSNVLTINLVTSTIFSGSQTLTLIIDLHGLSLIYPSLIYCNDNNGSLWKSR